MRWVMSRAASAHGVCAWFDCETIAGSGIPIHLPPASATFTSNCTFLAGSRQLMAGDQVEVGLRADFIHSDYVWSWKTRVLSGERVRAEFRQSSFAGTPISPDRFRKRSQEFVPDLNEDSQIDGRGLDLMAAKALARRDRESTPRGISHPPQKLERRAVQSGGPFGALQQVIFNKPPSPFRAVDQFSCQRIS